MTLRQRISRGRRRTIRLKFQVADGQRTPSLPIDATAHGNWAFHRAFEITQRDPDNNQIFVALSSHWTVTHVPTGKAVAITSGEEMTTARELARWLAINDGELPERWWTLPRDAYRAPLVQLVAAALAALGLDASRWAYAVTQPNTHGEYQIPSQESLV